MEPVILRPDERFQRKLFVAAGLLALVVLGFVLGLMAIIGFSEGWTRGMRLGMFIALAVNLLWLAPLFLLIPPYYRSLSYEIRDDEVIVRAGVITKSVKHVPYRTVTNLKVMRDPLDRLFGIGKLLIQTAGMSGQTGAEESLVGLTNYEEVYEMVAAAIRRFRGAMPPTQAGEEEAAPVDGYGQTLAEILEEVRAIREALNREG